MTEISQSQLRREIVEVALWQTPSPKPDAAMMSLLSHFDFQSNDQAVGNKAVKDDSRLPEMGPLSTFGSWESVASTIVHKAATLSNFDPRSPEFDVIAWDNFLGKFATMPFFLTYTDIVRAAEISSLSLAKGINTVSDLLENIMTKQDFDGVVTSIKKIGQLALENEGKTQKNSNQQVGVLSRHAEKLYLGTVRTVVVMRYKEGKGYEQLTQLLVARCAYGVLDFDKCKRHADTLLGWDRQDVEDWEKETASYPKPPNTSPAWDQ
ncbi:hypothetical protein [Nocardia terpenica]|uniref:Uncharacterized protein n=1 Tax=Nocardia terpenica TaxID=455432 RepID=A0A291RTA6_9NOCA|nr:hypothetical protein [Nocardia terpenica]ATL70464.1 hypothetical protein CRH09_34075 [Nocardia terpenica]